MYNNAPDVSPSFQTGKWGERSRVTSLTEPPPPSSVYLDLSRTHNMLNTKNMHSSVRQQVSFEK